MSGYHKCYAEKAKNSVLKDVMEVLNTIADEKMGVDKDKVKDNLPTVSGRCLKRNDGETGTRAISSRS